MRVNKKRPSRLASLRCLGRALNTPVVPPTLGCSLNKTKTCLRCDRFQSQPHFASTVTVSVLRLNDDTLCLDNGGDSGLGYSRTVLPARLGGPFHIGNWIGLSAPVVRLSDQSRVTCTFPRQCLCGKHTTTRPGGVSRANSTKRATHLLVSGPPCYSIDPPVRCRLACPNAPVTARPLVAITNRCEPGHRHSVCPRGASQVQLS